jgi:hypothetical protein
MSFKHRSPCSFTAYHSHSVITVINIIIIRAFRERGGGGGGGTNWVTRGGSTKGWGGNSGYLKVAPDSGGRELGQTFYGSSNRQGAVQGIHDTVDVMQRQAVQDAVPLPPFPGRA